MNTAVDLVRDDRCAYPEHEPAGGACPLVPGPDRGTDASSCTAALDQALSCRPTRARTERVWIEHAYSEHAYSEHAYNGHAYSEHAYSEHAYSEHAYNGHDVQPLSSERYERG